MSGVSRVFMALGAVLAALSVALSAAAAHVPALQAAGATFSASLEMQQLHALGLLLVGLAHARHPSRWLLVSGGLMLLGQLLFCLNIDVRLLWGWDQARALVPWGGSAFMLAWLALAVGVFTPER
ncbi:MAG: hypothetical protein RL559_1118 [Pseudomonadota bacterium]|jgi:uncharacterized membrane protein YgdD (TMEM256/DUF423 family)